MVSETDATRLPLAPLNDLIDWCREGQVTFVIIGGVAAAILGRPRVTHDVDILVILSEDRWSEFLALGSRFNFAPRISDPIAFASHSRVLLVRHLPSEIDVDVTLGALPFEKQALARARIVSVEGQRLPFLTPEDLIIMKAVANRPQDWADVRVLLDAHHKLDLRRIRHWTRTFADILENPEIAEDLEKLIAYQRRLKRRKDKP